MNVLARRAEWSAFAASDAARRRTLAFGGRGRARLIAALVTTVLAGSPQVGAPEPLAASVVGLWELSRFDDVPPPEAPPWGAHNLYVTFSSGGRVQVLSPGAAQPFEGEYSLQGDQFAGWLGLTNDPSGRARLAWGTADRIEVTYPDGSVASLRRLSTEPSLPDRPAFHCVPVTVRGVDFDADHVARAKRLLDDAEPAAPPKELAGGWSLASNASGIRTRVDLHFGEDGVVHRCTATEGEYSPASAQASEARYFVVSGHLVSPLFACGDPLPFRIEGQRLIVQVGEEVAFRREADSGGAPGECK